MAELETVTIKGLPVLKVGVWNGIRYTKAILDALADAHEETVDKLDPPVKLGHDDKQKLLQNDGYPAAGWVRNLRRVGSDLLADLINVPKKLAELIKVRAYGPRSVEIRRDITIGGREYPWVLTGLAFLGADLPAVEGLNDIPKLYQSLGLELDEDAEVIVLAKEVGTADAELELESILGDLERLQERAERLIKNQTGAPTLRQLKRSYAEGLRRVVKLSNVDDIELIWEETENQIRHSVKDPGDFEDGSFRTITLQGVEGIQAIMGRLKGESKIVIQSLRFDKAKWTMAEAKAWAKEHNFSREVEMEQELREILALDQDADVLDAVKALKESKAETRQADGGDQELSRQLAEAEKRILILEGEATRREAGRKVDGYIQAGRLFPKQRDVALKLALRDDGTFEEFIKTQPEGLVELGERGTANTGEINVAALEPSQQEVSIGAQLMGSEKLARSGLIRQKAKEQGAELPADFGEDKKKTED